MFNYDVPLQNPELVLRRFAALKTRGRDIQAVLGSIAEVLQLERSDISLSAKGLLIRGPWGEFHPIRGVGDGFQATLAWVVDFLGWALFYDEAIDFSEIAGIVLIDELEQHLHPRWQRNIISLLSGHFPNVQFVVTTHTPMCAVGTAALPENRCELIVLKRDGNRVVAIQDLSPPRGKRADQVLTSELFGLATTTSDDLTHDVARYAQLRGAGKLSEGEEREAAELFTRLQTQLTSSETPFETAVKEEVSKALSKLAQGALQSDAVSLEVIRQLRKLASS